MAARKTREKLPCALTIAGSDSGGGAGIQADLKTFAALGTHGTSAITCLTAQNPEGVYGIQATKPDMVAAQIRAVCEAFQPAAAKTGMLYSAAIINKVREVLADLPHPPQLVVDPVMVATSGAKLLRPSAEKALKELLPQAALVTPNLDETEILVGHPVTSAKELPDAAKAIYEKWGCPVLVKGGHLKGKLALDVLHDGQDIHLLAAKFTRKVSTHGTGCTYSAAIAAFLAMDHNLLYAVEMAKQFISGAIANSVRVRRHDVLNPFWLGHEQD